LHKGIANSRDPHVYEYGQRQQFWIPLPEDLATTPVVDFVLTNLHVVCVNVLGLDDELTEGREYEMKALDESFVTIVNDKGERKQYLMERFKQSQGAAA
jgi:hypothetical protein